MEKKCVCGTDMKMVGQITIPRKLEFLGRWKNSIYRTYQCPDCKTIKMSMEQIYTDDGEVLMKETFMAE